MASAMVNNIAALSPVPFPRLSPRISFSHDFPPDVSAISPQATRERSDADASRMDLVDFEFRHHHHPVYMLPADELFSEGKLVPLQLPTSAKPAGDETVEESPPATEIRSPELPTTRLTSEVTGSDTYVFSPRAPRCASRWRELLGLRRIQSLKANVQKAAIVASAGKTPNVRSLKKLLHRNHKNTSAPHTSLNLPLLREADSESAPITSSHASLSSSSSSSNSSSSCADQGDLPRFSLDSEKKNKTAVSVSRNPPPQVRLVRPVPTVTTEGHQPGAARAGRSPVLRAAEFAPPPPGGVSADSPRMSSSGKIVYHGLERSSSSPGSFTGGPRPRPRRIERSYSANVRVAPVLNVPVRSLCGSGKPGSAAFGLGHLFAPQKKKKEKDGQAKTGSSNSARPGSSKPKIDRKIKPNIN